jgi:hypothetical protein
LQICHFLSYIFIFSGRSFRQKSAGDVRHEVQLKRKHEDAVCYSDIKKRRIMELTDTSLEDAVEIFGGPLISLQIMKEIMMTTMMSWSWTPMKNL